MDLAIEVFLDFMLPDGAVLENIDPSKTEKVKVIALRGDDFLKHLSQEEVGAHTRNYALNLSDLPSTALIKDTVLQIRVILLEICQQREF